MNKDLILEDSLIKEIFPYFEGKRYCNSLKLVGGAVIDLLEGRKPKDYDFLNGNNDTFIKALKEMGFKFRYETKTAITYTREKQVVQLLKTKINEFDFKISQSTFSFANSNILDVDKASFENKLLIPISFDNKAMVVNSLKRKIHWEKKGYTMPDETYLSLCNALYKNQIDNS